MARKIKGLPRPWVGACKTFNDPDAIEKTPSISSGKVKIAFEKVTDALENTSFTVNKRIQEFENRSNESRNTSHRAPTIKHRLKYKTSLADKEVSQRPVSLKKGFPRQF